MTAYFIQINMTAIFTSYRSTWQPALLHTDQHDSQLYFIQISTTDSCTSYRSARLTPYFIQISTTDSILHTDQHDWQHTSYRSACLTAVLHADQHDWQHTSYRSARLTAILHTDQHDWQLYFIQINFTLTTKAILRVRALSSCGSENSTILHISTIVIFKLHTVHHFRHTSSSSVWNRSRPRTPE